MIKGKKINIYQNRVRLFFFLILFSSVSLLIYYNLKTGNQPNKISTVVFIFGIVFLCFSQIVYEAYCVMRVEMLEKIEELTRVKNELQTTYDSISMFMIELDCDYRILNANQAVSNYLKTKKSAILGNDFFDIFLLQTEFYSTLQTTIQIVQRENKIRKLEIEKDHRIYEVFIYPLDHVVTEKKKSLLVWKDITEETANRLQLLQNNKMIAVGQLASGVAHEIRNPLGIIRTYCHLLKKNNFKNSEINNDAIEVIERSVEKSNKIIDILLGFSRKSNHMIKKINLNQTIQTILALEASKLEGNRIKVELDCPDPIEGVFVLESLEMILINLINNATDAMPKGGTLLISCKTRENRVKLMIKDEGVGMSKGSVDNIFNPFYTTKEIGKGEGLGLFIVYNQVMELKGSINVESEVGIGTTFEISLPFSTDI